MEEIGTPDIITNLSVKNSQIDMKWIEEKQKKLMIFMKHPPKHNEIIIPYKGTVHTYDLTQRISGHYECLRLKLRPDPMVCLYPDAKDNVISYSIRHHGIWEPDITMNFIHILLGNKDHGVIDIGANIGVYTLIGAAMDRHVLAIEPYRGHVHHLHKAISIGGYSDRVTLITDAISDKRREHVHLHLNDKDNLGSLMLKDGCPKSAQKKGTCFSSILMDDITNIAVKRFPKKSVILKIDIEGHEPQAFIHSTLLFDSLNVTFIIMEWHRLRSTFIGPEHESLEKSAVLNLIWILNSRGYSAYTYNGENNLRLLNLHEWFGWPEDIIWKHENSQL